jgi:hypothetical protein
MISFDVALCPTMHILWGRLATIVFRYVFRKGMAKKYSFGLPVFLDMNVAYLIRYGFSIVISAECISPCRIPAAGAGIQEVLASRQIHSQMNRTRSL